MESMLDDVEADLASELKGIARDHRDLYKEMIRDVPTTDADRIKAAKEEIKAEIKPRYEEAVREAYRRVYSEAQTITREENSWIDDAASREMASNLDNSIEIKLSDLVDEIFQRQDGSLSSQSAEQMAQSPDGTPNPGDRQLDLFADSTFENMSQKVSGSSMNQARHDLIESEADRTDGRMFAVRNAQMDDNTCYTCEQYHQERFVVGSAEYWSAMPPAGCAGGSACRCWYEYEEPSGQRSLPFSDVEQSIELADQQPDDGTWVKILSWGQVNHDSGDFEVDQQFADDLISSFEFCREYGEGRSGLPPIQRSHQDDGKVYGDVTGLETRDDGIYARLDFRDWMLPLVRDGAIDRISPHVDPDSQHQEADRTFDWRLLEVSFVSRQHLQSIPNLAQYQFSDSKKESIMPDNVENQEAVEGQTDEGSEDSTEMADESVEMADIAKMLQKMGKRIKQIEQVVMPDEDEGDEAEGETEESAENADDEDKEMSDLRKENEKLREQVAESRVMADMSGYDLDDSSTDRLKSLAMSDSDLYEDTISLIKDNRDSDQSISLSDSEVGSTGSPSTGSSAEQVIRQAKEEGIEMGAQLIDYCDKHDVEPDLATAEKIYS